MFGFDWSAGYISPFRAADAPIRKVWCKFHHEATVLPRLRWANTAELHLDLPLQPTATDDLERLLQVRPAPPPLLPSPWSVLPVEPPSVPPRSRIPARMPDTGQNRT